MRIEGTYTFPTTIDRVFAALLSPDVLKSTIPGCQRIIQLGPVTPAGSVTFEARIQSERDGPATLTFTTTGLRPPSHLQMEITGYAAGARLSGHTLIDLVDLVEQGNHTLGAYVLTLPAPGGSPDATHQGITAFCEQLADYLYTERLKSETTISPAEAEKVSREPLADPAPMRSARVNGQIMALPGRWSLGRLVRPESSQTWRHRALWMGTGMLIGISVLSIADLLVRWLGDHEG